MVSIHSKISRADGRAICLQVQHSCKLCAISVGKIMLRTILVWNGIFFCGGALILSPWRILRCRGALRLRTARQAPILPQLGRAGKQN
jgi:hypothetical protein